MKTIKIFVLHPYYKDFNSFLKDSCLRNLQDKFKFEWNPDKPDYLISSQLVYFNYEYREAFKKLYRKVPIHIFFAGEAVTPDFNLFDYAIGFDNHLNNDDRFVQLPHPMLKFSKFIRDDYNYISDVVNGEAELQKKSKFCNFLYSNPTAHPRRDQLFHLLSKYKRVDSMGKHLNNVGVPGTGYLGHHMDCIDLKKPYKFSIACENASFSGYTSEKILTSLQAHTVPIYWGNPDIMQDINPECFINCNNLSDDEVVARVREVDNNDDLWIKMVTAPWRTDEQIEAHSLRYANYLAFWNRIFSSSIEEVSRRPLGTWPTSYINIFFSTALQNPRKPLINRILSKTYHTAKNLLNIKNT